MAESVGLDTWHSRDGFVQVVLTPKGENFASLLAHIGECLETLSGAEPSGNVQEETTRVRILEAVDSVLRERFGDDVARRVVAGIAREHERMTNEPG